ncbi:MAG: glycosyltransferase family 87 protein [Thermoleophilia bacterium]
MADVMEFAQESVQGDVARGVSGRRRRPGLLAIAVVLVVVALTTTVAIVVHRNSPLDFYVYYIAGALAAHGHSAYVVTGAAWDNTARVLGITHYTSPYRYPPYTAAVVRLLVPLGPFRAMVVWEVISAAALFAGAWLLGKALGGGIKIPLTLLVLVVFVPIYNMLADGQVDGLVFFFLALAFWGLVRKRDFALGGGVAVAAALKLVPVILIGYLVWRRRWRAALIAVAVLAGLTLLSWPLTGLNMFSDYAQHAFALTASQQIALSPQNQTAQGVAGRLLLKSATWSWTTWANTGRVRLVRTLANVFAVVLVVATAVLLWPRRWWRGRWLMAIAARIRARRSAIGEPSRALSLAGASAGAGEDELGFGMVIAASLVIGPFTFYHEFVWLLILLLVIGNRFLVGRRWRLLTLVGILILAIDLNELVWVGALWAGLFNNFWEWPYHMLASVGLWRMLSLPFAATLVAWSMAFAMVIADRRRATLKSHREV